MVGEFLFAYQRHLSGLWAQRIVLAEVLRSVRPRKCICSPPIPSALILSQQALLPFGSSRRDKTTLPAHWPILTLSSTTQSDWTIGEWLWQGLASVGEV